MTKKWPWGRDTIEDEVHIRDETGHEWWAGRERLDTPINRRWRKPRPGGQYPFRRASDRPEARREVDHGPIAASPLFAPPGDDTPATDWSTEALFTSTDDATAAPAEPAFAPAEAPSPIAASPWSELGLTSDASWDEVVQRHRELAKEHHPDRHSLGPGRARRVAEVRMAAINAAFADLDRIYGITDDK